MRILMVDDTKDLRETIMEMIEMKIEGVKVVQAEDGSEAIEKLVEFMATGKLPDVVISDFQMPKVNGFELAKFMKSNNILRGIPVIIMSTGWEVRGKVEKLGCKFLEKPFKIGELLALLPK